MNKILSLITISFLVISCNPQPKNETLFKSELSPQAENEFIKNSPFNDLNSLVSNFKYYNYFKLYGNSSAQKVYELNSDTENIFNQNFNSYIPIERADLLFEEANYSYLHSKLNIVFPEIEPEIDGIAQIKSVKDEGVEIYIIRNGKLKDAFNKDINEPREYEFSTGIYLLRKQKKIIYWFLINDKKNRR